MRRRRLILGAAAAGLTALALLLGGVLRESSSASPAASSAARRRGERAARDRASRPGDTAGDDRDGSRPRCARARTTSTSLDPLGLAYQQRARETGDPTYYTKSGAGAATAR